MFVRIVAHSSWLLPEVKEGYIYSNHPADATSLGEKCCCESFSVNWETEWRL